MVQYSPTCVTHLISFISLLVFRKINHIGRQLAILVRDASRAVDSPSACDCCCRFLMCVTLVFPHFSSLVSSECATWPLSGEEPIPSIPYHVACSNQEGWKYRSCPCLLSLCGTFYRLPSLFSDFCVFALSGVDVENRMHWQWSLSFGLMCPMSIVTIIESLS